MPVDTRRNANTITRDGLATAGFAVSMATTRSPRRLRYGGVRTLLKSGDVRK